MEIFDYVKEDNLVELKKYSQYNRLDVVDDFGRGLLHYAAAGRALVCINILIDFGINTEIKDNNGQTAIFDAAIKGNLGVLKILTRKKCNVNVKDNFGNTPLFYAIKTNKRAVVDILFDTSDLKLKNNNDEDATLISMKYNYHDLNKFLIDTSNLNCNKDGILHYAVKYNNIKIVKSFINRLNVNQKNKNNETVFFYAVKYSNRDIVRLLLNYLPVLDIKNKFSETLIEQVKYNHYSIDDLIENYSTSLDFIYYKQQNSHIYDYLCTSNVVKVSTILENKKDNFSLSLLDYIEFNNEIYNYKKLN